MDRTDHPAARRLLVAAALGACVFIVARLAGAYTLSVVGKLVPMLALASFVGRFGTGRDRVAVTVALGLSGIGDVLIEYPPLFVPAMVAFACAHVAYVVGFVRTDSVRAVRPLLLLGVGGYASGLVAVAHGALGPLRIPVMAYAAVITTMMWRALARVPAEGVRRSDVLVAVSAVVFGLSDSLILLKLAHLATDAVDPLILATYWAAQLGFAWAATTPEARTTSAAASA